MISYTTTPTCVFCDSIDTPEHFVWACPIKQSVWQSIASRYLVSPRELTLHHIISLSLAGLSVRPEFKLTFFDIIATTLLQIWSAHWHFVFHQTTFWSNGVIAKTILHLP
ncbi:hypothetical protein INT45_007192 [Circinella minor]|uniref:Reverse transcriptase zinc-binding domain-containing protein n=1 Tax=Circinella minor TaxID=1195481 RepID=A0A8H7S3S5_9FUNG|nr:hypothetical protein INT45_007192 [Circinella minor]